MRPGKIVLAIVLGLTSVALPGAAKADTAPTSGTFDGYYHRDRFGVGNFTSLYVAAELHETLAKVEDKLIRLTATKIEQPMNPGPAFITAIGPIEELPQPLRLTIKTRPSQVVAGEPFELILQVSDTRPAEPNGRPDFLTPEVVLVDFRQPVVNPGAYSDWPKYRYTGKQLAFDTTGGQIGVNVWPFPGGRPNLLIRSGAPEFQPGDSWSWVVTFPAGAARTDGEVHVTGSYHVASDTSGKGERTPMPLEAWQPVSVRPSPTPKDPATAEAPILRMGDVSLDDTGENGWSKLRMTILPAEGKRVRVPGAINGLDGSIFPDGYLCVGRLDGFTSAGAPVELVAERIPDTHHADAARSQMLDLPESGIVVTAHIRKTIGSRFDSKLARLTASFVTEHGVETLTVVDDYHDLDTVPAPPFGPEDDGVKMRVRPDKASLRAGTAFSFFAQAVNTSGKPVCWWRPARGYGENVFIEIDNKPVQLPADKADSIGGWAAKWTVATPEEWTVTLPETVRLAKGPHTLRYSILSEGGTYTNANGQPIPLLDGVVASNEVGFSVE